MGGASSKRQRQKAGRQSRLAAAQAAQRRAQMRRRIIGIVVVVALFLGIPFVVFGLLGDDDDGQPVNTRDSTSTTADGATPASVPPIPEGRTLSGPTPCPPEDGAADRVSQFSQPPPMCLQAGQSYNATLETTEGDIVVELDTTTTPQTANNFAVLARYGYYDGSAIHRTDPSIDIIQGGAPHTQNASDPGPGYNIPDEGDASTRTYTDGDLVMARSQGPNSGGAQFFFVAGPAAAGLNAGQGPGGGTYVTFGKVVEGLEVVKRILALHAADPTSQLGGAPRRRVVVEKVVIERRAA